MPTERAFWEDDRYFRLLVDNAEEYAIFSLDLGGRITTWNRGAERLLGWHREEAVGQPGAIVFTDEDRARGMPAREMSRARAEGRAEDRRWHVKKGGERFWANGIMETVRDESGELVGFAKILRDRTEARRYEETLEEKNAELEAQTEALAQKTEALTQSNRNLQSFAGHVAHEVRSPLMGMRLVLTSLLRKHEETLDEETLAMTRQVESSIRDLNRFTTDLLSYSQLAEERRLPERECVESAETLRKALNDLKRLIEEHGAEVEVETETLPAVSAIPSLLRHLFRNLVANAIEHNDADVPRIRIEADEGADAWEFRVVDNGPGVAAEDRERIFEFFQQQANGGDASGGVGLALARRIVEVHGGRIGVRPRGPESGSIFFFTLPKHPPDAKPD